MILKQKNIQSCIIHEDTKFIYRTAFFQCANLTSITIPDGVVGFGETVFRLCTNLTSVVIPKSVASINDFVFDECDSLTSVYYTGTSEEWAAAYIGENNAPLAAATIYYYSETEPAEEGNYWHYVDGVVAVW